MVFYNSWSNFSYVDKDAFILLFWYRSILFIRMVAQFYLFHQVFSNLIHFQDYLLWYLYLQNFKFFIYFILHLFAFHLFHHRITLCQISMKLFQYHWCHQYLPWYLGKILLFYSKIINIFKGTSNFLDLRVMLEEGKLFSLFFKVTHSMFDYILWVWNSNFGIICSMEPLA